VKPVNIYDAKTRFSELVDKAAAGDEVIVSRNGKPLVRITRLEGGQKQRIKFGTLKGKIKLSADFDAPLPDEVLAGFEGR
jgi:prevent-host-death family protein